MPFPNPDTQFKPGSSGRPKGSKNKRTVAIDKIVKIMDKYQDEFESSLEGDAKKDIKKFYRDYVKDIQPKNIEITNDDDTPFKVQVVTKSNEPDN